MTELLLKLFVKDYKDVKNPKVRERYGLLGSIFGLVTNLILFLGKIIIGIMLHLFSIISDSVNNLSDFANNGLSIFGFRISGKKADKEHPFGHQRMEYVMSLIIACVIIALGFIMVYQGIVDLVEFCSSCIDTGHPPTGSIGYTEYVATLSVLSIAILLKVLQSYLYFNLGKRIDSVQLNGLGRDALNDCISTSTVIIGLVISWFTSYDVDCFFTIFVAGLVIVSGFQFLLQSVDLLIGKRPDDSLIKEMIKIATEKEGVKGIHDLMIHSYGSTIFAVMHVEVDAREDVMNSHMLCDNLEREVREKLGIQLTVHMDPILIDDPETEQYKQAVEDALATLPVHVPMHDFRIVSSPEFVNLIFDLVTPEEYDSDEGREELKKTILDYVDNKYGKRVYLVIGFDNYLTDFLYGTSAEEKDG